jgi:hypothetical protein
VNKRQKYSNCKMLYDLMFKDKMIAVSMRTFPVSSRISSLNGRICTFKPIRIMIHNFRINELILNANRT